MDSLQYSFSALHPYSGPSILMGDYSEIQGFEVTREEEVGKTQMFRWGFESLQGQGKEEGGEYQMHLLPQGLVSRECMYE